MPFAGSTESSAEDHLAGRFSCAFLHDHLGDMRSRIAGELLMLSYQPECAPLLKMRCLGNNIAKLRRVQPCELGFCASNVPPSWSFVAEDNRRIDFRSLSGPEKSGID